MKFQPGQSGNPNGRPKKAVEEKYMHAVYSAVKPDELKEICEALAKKAKHGDVQAAKILLGYLAGVPVQKIAPVTPDGENPYMSLGAEELIALAKKIADAGSEE